VRVEGSTLLETENLYIAQQCEKKQQRETQLMSKQDKEGVMKTQSKPPDKGILSFFPPSLEGSLRKVRTRFKRFYHEHVRYSEDVVDIDVEVIMGNAQSQPPPERYGKVEDHCIDPDCDGSVTCNYKSGDVACVECGKCFRGIHSFQKSYSDMEHLNTRPPAPYERIAHVSFAFCLNCYIVLFGICFLFDIGLCVDNIFQKNEFLFRVGNISLFRWGRVCVFVYIPSIVHVSPPTSPSASASASASTPASTPATAST
jgi:hypothetical protein